MLVLILHVCSKYRAQTEQRVGNVRNKKGAEFYQISVGGHSGHGGQPASLGQILGPSFARDEVPDVIEKILKVFTDSRYDDETFLSTYRRVGIDPFKEHVYAPAD